MSKFLQRRAARAAAAPVATPKTNAEALALIEQLKRQVAETQTRSAREIATANDRAAKAQRELEAAAEERRLARIRGEIARAAKAHGAVDEEDVADLVMARGKFALTDDGKVTLADKPEVEAGAHVALFLEARPHLARKRTAEGSGASTTPRAPAAPPPPATHDLRTREGATAAAHEALRAKLGAAPASPTTPPGGAPGRGN